MTFAVREPGLFSLLVAAGRTGSRRFGLPLGGPADRAAAALANALVGNPRECVTLEVAFAGPTLEAREPAFAALFGAPFGATVYSASGDARQVEPASNFALQPGDTLRVGGTPRGARGYLAVSGGFASAEVLGSRDALEPIRLGDVLGHHGDGLAWPALRLPGAGMAGLSDQHADSVTLRAVPGSHAGWFAADALFARPFVVSPASNRMGVRLTGPPLERLEAREMTSEPAAPGTVQVANDGLPIVLGVDGQTIGGYPRVAHVVAADLDLVGQLRPGGAVRFVAVTLGEAEAAWGERRRLVEGWCRRVALRFG